MNTSIMRLPIFSSILLVACSMAAIAQEEKPALQTLNMIQSTNSSALSLTKKSAPAELVLQRELGQEALRIALRHFELYKETSKFRKQGNPIPPEMQREMDVLEIRQKEIADQQFSLSGHLFLKASEPGVFTSYVGECLNRINRALSEDDPELRRHFYGRTTWVQLDLTAGGKIESVIPRPSKQDKEFGDYLHDLIWKVSAFPEVPQLKDRSIERVSLSMPFTLQKEKP